MSPTNNAAWIMEKTGKPLQVKESPYPVCSETDIIIQNKAVSINPVDWKIQDTGFYIDKYPAILGCDVAGEVVEVGSNVKDFKKGDRVLGHCPALISKKTDQAGFQHYTSIPQILAAKIPSSMTFAQATVLPLGISTAAAGLYQKDFLNLQLPAAGAKATGKTVLVWGGASSVGSCAIQLLAHSGYEVVATASKHNFEYCKALGAAQVFDYTSSSCNDDIVAALKGKQVAGIYDSISLPPTVKACTTIAIEADIENKFIALTLPPPQEKTPGVEIKNVFAISILYNEVGPAVYKAFLPEAMEKGDFKAKPDPIVVGSGLEKVQEGMDKLKAGVSAGKVVIEL